MVSQYGVVDDLTMAVYLASELVRAVDEVRAIIMHAAADVEKVQRLIDGSLSSELVSLVEASRPQLRVLEVAVLSARVPDIAVYNQARQLYAAYLASYQAQIEPALVTADGGGQRPGTHRYPAPLRRARYPVSGAGRLSGHRGRLAAARRVPTLGACRTYECKRCFWESSERNADRTSAF